MSRQETYKQLRKKRMKKSFGENLFKVLFYILLVVGVLSIISAFFFDVYFTLFISSGINTILFSFAFKFMESVIVLLREIKEDIQG